MKMRVNILALSLAALIAFAASVTPAHAQNGNGSAAASASILLSAPTRGVVFKTAAINADGSKAQGFRVAGTIHLSTGNYQVTFDENVQALNGFSRWVQVDTLEAGSISGVSCTTADRAGVGKAVFIHCENAAGPIDTSFFLFVAR
jgi:hypothetical protein